MLCKFSSMMKTTAARLSALYLLLFSLCAIFLVFYMTHLAGGFLVNQTKVSLDQELQSLNRVYNRGGIRLLVREIDRRSRRPDAFVYLISDQESRFLAGNIAKIDAGVLKSEGYTSKPFRYTRIGEQDEELDDDDAPRAIGQRIKFPNGLTILVGRDLGEPDRFRKIIRSSLGLALGMMGVGGLLIWFFVGRRALRRIDSVSQASAHIVGGDLSKRLPVSTANDEFDRLSVSLNAMLGRIEKLNSGLREVSDNIAHDLKTPLTRLRNRAEAALRSGKSDEDYRDALNDMIAESDQLIQLFNAMLLISRVEAGYSKHNETELQLTEIAEGVAELYEPLVDEFGGKLVSSIDNNLMVVGNRQLIGQALTNLVDNAVKYGRSEDTVISIYGRRSEDQKSAVLIIEDNGLGIPPENRERALQRFVRLDESRSEPGSGLGLSLVAAIMDMHKGTFVLEDAEPGLRAVLTFPIQKTTAKT
ncbi:ATP-binding protein [Ahrensia sp. 13_GOM-1096m]|uniref:sensor histidine kinase n=1 Tax=Ahrensia sp. 13_GOM-1096m TaxID=1380380 RepID=UPI00047A8603|nr:ATP-binding protein [Ahrensia sp. 13_GOM-1096m]